MSALGQKRTYAAQQVMSALHPIATAKAKFHKWPCPLYVKSRHMQCNNHVRFTPDSDRESGFPRKVMSALPPKANSCSALAHVRFGPKADIRRRGLACADPS